MASTDVEENRAPTQDLPDLWAICNEVAQDPATARLLYRMIAGYPMAPPSPELRRLAHQVMDRVWDLYFAPDRYALRVGQELEGHRLDGQRQGRAVVVAIEGEQVGERTVVIEWEDQSRDRIHEDVLWRHLRPRRGART